MEILKGNWDDIKGKVFNKFLARMIAGSLVFFIAAYVLEMYFFVFFLILWNIFVLANAILEMSDKGYKL